MQHTSPAQSKHTENFSQNCFLIAVAFFALAFMIAPILVYLLSS